MDISTGLIAKGTAGLAAASSVTAGVIYKDKISDFFGIGKEGEWNEDTLLEKTGLNCKSNQVCSLESGRKIKIKQNSNTSEEIDNLPTSPGKLKLQVGAEGYSQNLKFTVEEGDIALNASGNVTKLERDETYEIAEEGDKWILVRKSTALEEINKKLENLGLPEDCRFEENKNPKNCNSLNVEALKKIKFQGFGEGFEASIEEGEITLKIAKVTENKDKVEEVFTDGIKIIFENKGEITLSGGGAAASVSWKKGTNPEFKINSFGKLEGAWTVNKLAEKVGLTCPVSSDSNECSFEENKKINVHEGSSNKKSTNLKVTNANSKKLLFSESEENYNQGVKFTVKGADIALTADGGGSAEIGSLTKANTSYEIKYMDDGWYLHKITPTRS